MSSPVRQCLAFVLALAVVGTLPARPEHLFLGRSITFIDSVVE